MVILVLIGVVLLVAAIFGPSYWIKHVLKVHGAERADLPGTGGELARHLLDEAGLHDVKLELTDEGDHYDPDDRTVRLLPQHLAGRSIAAVAVAAHEVSHAVQHARGERAFAARLALVKNLSWIDNTAMIILLASPLLFAIVRAPILLLIQLVVGIGLLAVRIVIHLATLPVEFDASFGKALPVLQRGNYLSPSDMPAARGVLRAAAWTYVAAALATLLDVARWLRVLRF
jgi:Zn-dependent membrane protease YugP